VSGDANTKEDDEGNGPDKGETEGQGSRKRNGKSMVGRQKPPSPSHPTTSFKVRQVGKGRQGVEIAGTRRGFTPPRPSMRRADRPGCAALLPTAYCIARSTGPTY